MREFFCHLGMLLLAVAFMTLRPSCFVFCGQVPDFLFALQFYAAYFYRGKKSVRLCLLAGFVRDLLFGPLLGPDMLTSLFIALLGPLFFSEASDRSPGWALPQALILFPLSRLFRGEIFALLPLPERETGALGARMLRNLAGSAEAVPGMVFALAVVMTILHFFPLEGRKRETAELFARRED